ncbi:hypothetical protein R455_004720 [Salmonella enterica subsp. enterica]|nr:hypothetical protein [Salmonella enterica subsp. enterica serovar Wandsworth]EDW6595330.1 hypothetical protein [Salmonella enterica]EDT6631066.1 hypothetical protein [Salmonella enterica subsp. enterica serovar Wandsworth]EDT6699387.1 hypothetical protein [Salmonella enterica subsp. enterica serovar Wandsworth]EDT6704390.1 hypothetical protein [Salmonella enterica subsp. enterica serovar Wandsworth]
MLSKTGFTHSDLLCWQIDYAGGSLNMNGTIMQDIYTTTPLSASQKPEWLGSYFIFLPMT